MLIPISIIPRQSKIVKHLFKDKMLLQLKQISIPIVKVYKLVNLLLQNKKLPNDGNIINNVHHPLKNILYFGLTKNKINAVNAYILNAVAVLILQNFSNFFNVL